MIYLEGSVHLPLDEIFIIYVFAELYQQERLFHHLLDAIFAGPIVFWCPVLLGPVHGHFSPCPLHDQYFPGKGYV